MCYVPRVCASLNAHTKDLYGRISARITANCVAAVQGVVQMSVLLTNANPAANKYRFYKMECVHYNVNNHVIVSNPIYGYIGILCTSWNS